MSAFLRFLSFAHCLLAIFFDLPCHLVSGVISLSRLLG